MLTLAAALLLGAPEPTAPPERALTVSASATVGRIDGVGGPRVSSTPALLVGLRWGAFELALEGGAFVGLYAPPDPGPRATEAARLDGPRLGALVGYRALLPNGAFVPLRLRGGWQTALTSTPGHTAYLATSMGMGTTFGSDRSGELEWVALELQMLIGAQQSDGGAFSALMVQTGFRASYALGF